MDALPNQLENRYLTPAEPTDARVRRYIDIPKNTRFMSALDELISRLRFEEVWDDSDGISSADASQMAQEMFNSYVLSEGFMIGWIQPFANATTPTNMLPCDGTTYDAIDYPALFEVLDPAFKFGVQFQTPDLRGRVPVGEDTDNIIEAAIPLIVGLVGGSPLVGLLLQQLAAHQHTTSAHSHGGNITNAVQQAVILRQLTGAPSSPLDIPVTNNPTNEGLYDFIGDWQLFEGIETDEAPPLETNEVGEGEPHENMQPFTVVRYGIIYK